MIKAIIENLDGSAAALKRGAEEVKRRVMQAMNRALIRLQSHIQTKHLSAPPGYSATLLHQRSGKLINSIRVVPAEETGELIEGAVEGAGGPAFYGRIHEYGGSWAVPAHEAVRMRLTASGKLIGAKTFAVRSYTVTMPERSFMRASLSEMQSEIVSQMREAMGGRA
jgi:phage gpG-like protein